MEKRMRQLTIDMEKLRRQLSRNRRRYRREQRLNASSQTLYHQTSHDCAASILSSQQMNRGCPGLAGSGIYFAESPPETKQKATKKGVVLQAVVRLGRVKDVYGGQRDITFRQLQREGYDSVRILGRASGIEYVVYNRDQVRNIAVARC
jgi:hypothetical protein